MKKNFIEIIGGMVAGVLFGCILGDVAWWGHFLVGMAGVTLLFVVILLATKFSVWRFHTPSLWLGGFLGGYGLLLGFLAALAAMVGVIVSLVVGGAILSSSESKKI